MIPKEELFVHYGDVLTDHDLTKMRVQHQEKRALATILVHYRKESNSAVYLGSDDQVNDFLERPDKPVKDKRRRRVFSGLAILSPQALASIPNHQPCDLPRDVFPALAQQGGLYAHHLHGFRCAVDSPERLSLANHLLAHQNDRTRTRRPLP
jgi:mannose-1-phosphate guanylyltransferase/phosphomannomutase